MSLFTDSQEKYIEHEVRLRLTDERFLKIDNRLDETIRSMNDEFRNLRRENFTHFVATIGLIVTLFGGMILTKIFTG